MKILRLNRVFKLQALSYHDSNMFMSIFIMGVMSIPSPLPCLLICLSTKLLSKHQTQTSDLTHHSPNLSYWLTQHTMQYPLAYKYTAKPLSNLHLFLLGRSLVTVFLYFSYQIFLSPIITLFNLLLLFSGAEPILILNIQSSYEWEQSAPFALVDIVKEVTMFVFKMRMPSGVRVGLINGLADFEYRWSFRCNDKLQLGS